VSGGLEPKGSEALTITALSRAARSKPEPVSKARPEPDETLRLVLASLDDMKAEDTVTIDLRDKSSLADTMVVTSGRSNRHVG
jgi:ribosome-associated protein